MRAFCVLLLLLNVGVFFALTARSTDDPEPWPPQPASGSLDIVDERDVLAEAREGAAEPEADEVDSEDDSTDTGGLDTAHSCYRGPTMDEDAARELADAFPAERSSVTVEETEEREWIGYWVYIPEHENMESAQDTMSELAEQGVSDYGYVGGQETDHAVSLGVFSSESAAQRRQDEVENLGFPTETGERYQARMRYRVLVGIESGDELPDLQWEDADCQELDT